MAFTQKIIQCNLTSGEGGFSPLNTIGLRTTVHAIVGAADSMGMCDVLIYGLTLSHMNQISTLGWTVPKHNSTDQIQVYAGETSSAQGSLGFPGTPTGMALVFQGTIYQATSDFQGGPNLPLHVVAYAGLKETAMNVKPISVNNKSADFTQLWGQVAGQMGLQPETNGISVKLAYPYLWSSAREQAKMLAEAAGVNWAIDKGTLAAWPKDGSRTSGGTPLISPQTGMVGYPSWSSIGIKVKCLFNNQLQIGGQVQVQSSITTANGVWTIQKIEHNLQCLTPNGEWFTTFEASKGATAASGGASPVSGG